MPTPAFATVDDAQSFGERLRDHRRAAGLTQEELAEQAGLSPRSISELERGGAHIPRRDTVALLARALGLVGAEREAFGAAVERRRGARPTRTVPERTSIDQESSETAGKHNLPRLLTSFVGRQEELHELAPVLAAAPLLTLVGAGGVGKTRLAHELVRQQGASYPDGSWLVELAGLADASLVPGAVATAVGLQDVHTRNMTSVLTEYLRDRQLLLVLDNCEHLVSACAELVAHLLRACPNLRILATSREPLAIAGEITWRVLPLPLPDAGQALDVDELTRVPAAQLFVERAHAVNNTLTITPSNASALARICHSVDGIPLALELAAARTRLLTLDELAERLEHDPGVLRATDRAGLPQHRTIRATIDWSHDLLGEQEQMLLRRLSVFAGGWTLDMAVAVCTGGDIEPDAVLDLLAQLVDKSLVLMDGSGPVTRYRLLEPIRQYAVERLEASSEASVYRARHAETLLGFAQTAFESLAGPDELSALSRLEVDHDNLRTALRWAIVQADSPLALRSSSALFRFWESRGHFQEGGNWLEQALALPGARDALPEDRGRALNALSNLCWRGGHAERGRTIAELALAINREAGNLRGIAWSLGNLGMISHLRHEHELAVERLEESVAWARRGARSPLLSLSLTYFGRALLWLNGPDDRRVSDAVDESLALAEAAQSRYARGGALATLGDVRWAQGSVECAVPLWRTSLGVHAELLDRRGIAGSLERLGLVLAVSDQLEAAAWVFGAAAAQHTRLGMEVRDDGEPDHAHFAGVTRRQFPEAFDVPWSAGQEATLEEAVAYTLDRTHELTGLDQALPDGTREQYEFPGGVLLPRPRLTRAI